MLHLGNRTGGSLNPPNEHAPCLPGVHSSALPTGCYNILCYLAKYGRIASEATVMIEQGYALMRPSRIEVRLHGDEVRIFGAGVTVAEGVLRL